MQPKSQIRKITTEFQQMFEEIKNISVETLNYDLPDEKVAIYPLASRDQSKLLFWNNGEIQDHRFTDITDILPKDSHLVFNNTKVICARLHFKKSTGARIEIFVLDPVSPADYAQNFEQHDRCSWKCIIGNQKKWKTGSLHMALEIGGTTITLTATMLQDIEGSKVVEFTWDNSKFSFSEVIEAAGNLPIPPYLHRDTEQSDYDRYQTVYSKIKGSVAAPTAGLHFTDEVFEALQERGITRGELTLHVGAGTFRPVKADTIGEHDMHTEHIIITKKFIQDLLDNDRRTIAVGTTSIRTLESLYWIGVQMMNDDSIDLQNLTVSQWLPYELDVKNSKQEILGVLLKKLESEGLEYISASTQIIIVPGYKFRIVDGMVTNFHQPKSTLLLLISAFAGELWREVYQHALDNDYRFLSYGDSSLYMK